MTLNEAEPFNCVRCAKPFGTRQMVENMLGKLGGHSMFAGGTRRLQMCGDCRVVDMVENKAEAIDLRLSRSEWQPPRSRRAANFYGLLARLFYAPPDARAAPQLAAGRPDGARGRGNAEGRARRGLARDAARAAAAPIPEALATSTPAVRRHRQGAGHTLSCRITCCVTANETPLVELRAQLARLGLARREGVPESEDHIATLCDTMRFVIAVQRDPDEQQTLLRALRSAARRLCAMQ